MTPENISLLRGLLKIGAGMLITKGVIDSSSTELVISGGMAIAGLVWGYLTRNQKPETRNLPPQP